MKFYGKTIWQPGDKVIYLGSSDAQVDFCNFTDPRPILTIGETYIVLKVEVHTWHTRVSLVGFPGGEFNSVVFKVKEPAPVHPVEVRSRRWEHFLRTTKYGRLVDRLRREWYFRDMLMIGYFAIQVVGWLYWIGYISYLKENYIRLDILAAFIVAHFITLGIFKEKKDNGMKLITLWIEGYKANSESATASALGTFEAKDYDDAVNQWLQTQKREDVIDYHQVGAKGVHSWWACRIFDNETDARRSMG